MSKAEAGKVYLVGAGPGDPDLLTIKAARLLSEAGVVLHDDLVPQSILKLAGKQALIISVGKRCGRKKITQAAIHDLMIVSARNGLAVVRLKSGDPMIFGRAAEEIDALREAGVPFEVVPGVTAASSAAAFLEASLTDRRVSSKLIVLSGHHAARTIPEPDLWPGSLPDRCDARYLHAGTRSRPSGGFFIKKRCCRGYAMRGGNRRIPSPGWVHGCAIEWAD